MILTDVLDRTDEAPDVAVGPIPTPGRMRAALPLSFTLDSEHEAHQPPESIGSGRDDVRLLVSPGLAAPIHTCFASLPDHLQPGDLVVVNTSATVAAALDVVIDGHGDAVLHVSTKLPGDLWMVEPRRKLASGSTERLRLKDEPATVFLPDGRALLHLLHAAPDSERLWLGVAATGVDVRAAMAASGRPIRYQYVPRDWPLDRYQTVFATEAGSAEMPSAARPFTAEIVTQLVSKGVAVAPITLHTGVSSLEADERPYTERYRVPPATAALANATRRDGGHVIAIGTTVVRALETVTDPTGTVHPGSGWTDLVVAPVPPGTPGNRPDPGTPGHRPDPGSPGHRPDPGTPGNPDETRGVRAVDGLLTGWHEPAATHLALLEAVAGRQLLILAYETAFAAGCRWHEFGDSHLILPYA